jgi:hypothetical protein
MNVETSKPDLLEKSSYLQTAHTIGGSLIYRECVSELTVPVVTNRKSRQHNAVYGHK